MTENVNYSERNAGLIEFFPRSLNSLERDLLDRASKRYGLREHAAEEILQDSALEVCKYLFSSEFIGGQRELQSYIRTVFDRNCIDFIGKKEHRMRSRIGSIEYDLENPKNECPIEGAIRNETEGILRDHIDQLPVNYREAIREDLSGKHDGKKRTNYRSTLKRARQKLKASLIEAGVLELDVA